MRCFISCCDPEEQHSSGHSPILAVEETSLLVENILIDGVRCSEAKNESTKGNHGNTEANQYMPAHFVPVLGLVKCFINKLDWIGLETGSVFSADPHHMSRYLKSNSFLPLINGEKPHRLMEAWRDSFLRIKKMVLIGGPDDGVITPWQSSHFGFYDQNEDVVEMRNQEFYQRDTFGLKMLDERGDVVECVISGVKHTEWHSNLMVFQTCIEKWLT